MTTRTKMLVAGAVVVCSVLVPIFLPEVVSVGWHLFYGKFAKFGVWEFPVPQGWWAIKGKDTLVIQKMARWDMSDSEIIVLLLNFRPSDTIVREKWENAYTETESKDGYDFSSEREFRLDGETSLCLVFTAKSNAERRRIECAFPIHRLLIEYTGDKANFRDFDSVIQHVRASN
jgi:hypothetical protein